MSENWISDMEEDSAGDFVVFGDEDEHVLKICSEPTKGTCRFKNKDGSEKIEYVFECLQDASPKIMKWSVSSISLMRRIVQIMKDNKLEAITGQSLRVTSSGSGTDRRYVVRLIKQSEL